MNQELRECLSGLGWDGVDDAAMWKRVVVVLNYGRVPRRLSETDRGFKLLLLTRHGTPEWFGRCGWAERPAMDRETELLDTLRADPFGAAHIPESRHARTAQLCLQISRYLGEVSYSTFIDRRAPLDWMRDVREILHVSERLMRIARAHVPRLREPPSESTRRTLLDADLATLEAAGMPSSLLQQLRAAAAPSLELEPELQHGDLWPANVLRADHKWWLIDFAECGVVWSPLYDLLHLVATAPPAAGKAWYAISEPGTDDIWLTARRTLLSEAARRRRLSATQLAGCLIYYLVHLTAYRLRPGVEYDISANLRADLVRIGEFLTANGGDAAALLRCEGA